MKILLCLLSLALCLLSLALAGCGDSTRVTNKDGKVDVSVFIYDATPAAAAKRLRDLALSLDGGAK